MENIHIDFVIAENAGKIGYLSTNMACPIWGYKTSGTFIECLETMRNNYPDFTYTREGIIPNMQHMREFTPKDKIYANKIKDRLLKLPNPRTMEKSHARA